MTTGSVCRERPQGLLVITVSVWERPRGVRSCTRSEDYSGPSRCLRRAPGGVVPCAATMDPLLDGLDARQRDAVTSPANPLAILAPAGAGKTRVLTRRIALRAAGGFGRGAPRPRGHVHPQGRGRARRPGCGARRRGRHRRDLPRAGARATAPARTRAAPAGAHRARLEGPHPRRRSPAIVARVRCPRPRSPTSRPRSNGPRRASCGPSSTRPWRATAGRRPPRPFAEVADIYARYESREAHQAPLRLRRPALVVRGRDRRATRRSQPPSAGGSVTCSSTSSRTRHRCSSGCSGPGSVPDPTCASSATRRRRSTASPVPTRRRCWRSPTTSRAASVIALDRNYRSTPQIVAVAESVLAPDAAGARPEIVAVRPAGAGARRSRAYADDAAEAAGVAQGCWQAFTSGVPWSAIGVLFRTNAQSSLFEAALHSTRHPVPGPHRRPLRRATRGPRPARRTAHGRAGDARPRVRGAPGRSRHGREDEPNTPNATQPPEPPVSTPSRADEEQREHRDALVAPRP